MSPTSLDACPFLRLPLELRRQIYQYVLPQTCTLDPRFQRGNGEPPERSEYSLTLVRQASSVGVWNEVWKKQKTLPKSDREVGNEVVWHLGCTSLLTTCHQVHDECVDLIYGANVFVIDVTFNTINFRQRWRTASNLTPGRTYAFLDHFSQRNLLKIKNYVINIDYVDDYTGTIKFNCGGRGLTDGIRNKVQELVDLLGSVTSLHRVHIHLIDGAISRMRFPSGRVHRVQDVQNFATSQTVLEPFKGLGGVRKARVTGTSVEYAELLERTMTRTRSAPQT